MRASAIGVFFFLRRWERTACARFFDFRARRVTSLCHATTHRARDRIEIMPACHAFSVARISDQASETFGLSGALCARKAVTHEAE
jgi:hypothetical protein